VKGFEPSTSTMAT